MSLVLALPGNEAIAAKIAIELGTKLIQSEYRSFPDGESYVRLATDLGGKSVIVVATLDRPDAKFLPLYFAAMNARTMGASRVGLIAPYLAYMRQDQRFQPGEAVTSVMFAKLLSGTFDWLVTVDPHLHRIADLSTIYSVPARSAHAASPIADWIRREVASPILIGPDEESGQWIRAIAEAADADFIVLKKIRRGDLDVEVMIPDVERWRGHTPVLIDDIISTGRTMIETTGHLKDAQMKPPVCVGIHAVFAQGAYDALRAAGVSRIVTTNTIPHVTNAIDIVPLIAASAKSLL